MNEPLFRIKPLVWVRQEHQTSVGIVVVYNAKGVCTTYQVRDYGDGKCYLYMGGVSGSSEQFSLPLSGMAAADAHNREMMMQGLEEVK